MGRLTEEVSSCYYGYEQNQKDLITSFDCKSQYGRLQNLASLKLTLYLGDAFRNLIILAAFEYYLVNSSHKLNTCSSPLDVPRCILCIIFKRAKVYSFPVFTHFWKFSAFLEPNKTRFCFKGDNLFQKNTFF